LGHVGDCQLQLSQVLFSRAQLGVDPCPLRLELAAALDLRLGRVPFVAAGARVWSLALRFSVRPHGIEVLEDEASIEHHLVVSADRSRERVPAVV
jgi:hypothetical protein